jgi:hypothetical protein
MNVTQLHAVLESQIAAGHGATPCYVYLLDNVDVFSMADWRCDEVIYMDPKSSGMPDGCTVITAITKTAPLAECPCGCESVM